MNIYETIAKLSSEHLLERLDAADTLISGNPEAMAQLIDSMEHRQPEIRWRVLVILGERGVREAVAPIFNALTDVEWEVRHSAVWALGALGDNRANPVLNKILHETPEEQVRYVAAMSLRRIGDDEALQMLENAVLSADEGVRRAASATLHLNLYDTQR